MEGESDQKVAGIVFLEILFKSLPNENNPAFPSKAA